MTTLVRVALPGRRGGRAGGSLLSPAHLTAPEREQATLQAHGETGLGRPLALYLQARTCKARGITLSPHPAAPWVSCSTGAAAACLSGAMGVGGGGTLGPHPGGWEGHPRRLDHFVGSRSMRGPFVAMRERRGDCAFSRALRMTATLWATRGSSKRQCANLLSWISSSTDGRPPVPITLCHTCYFTRDPLFVRSLVRSLENLS